MEAEAYDLIALQRGLKLAAEGEALATRSLEIARGRQAAGLGDAVDVQLAAQAVGAARRQRVTLERDHALARARLAQWLGLDPLEDRWALADRLRLTHELPDVEALVETALARRLDVRVAELGVEVARGELDVERSSRVSELSLGFERERSESPPSLSGPVLEGSLPLWSRNEPGVVRRRFLLARAEEELRARRHVVAREVREAAARLVAAQALIDLFESDVLPRSEAAVETARRAWQAGERDILVTLEAQRTLLEEKAAYLQALRDGARARAALDAAVGGRSATDLEEDGAE